MSNYLLENASNLDIIDRLDPNVMIKLQKLETLNKYRETMTANPNMKQKDLLKKCGISQSKLSRTSRDLGVGSFHRSYNNSNRTSKKEPIGINEITFTKTMKEEDQELIQELIHEKRIKEQKKQEENTRKEENKRIHKIKSEISRLRISDMDLLGEQVTPKNGEISSRPSTRRTTKKGGIITDITVPSPDLTDEDLDKLINKK